MEAKNAKPKVNVEQTPQGESQSEAVEEAYFFHPVQLSEEKEEILDEKEIEKAKVEIEQKLQEFLKSISEETLQLSEFLIEEKTLINELCISLKQILKKLNISFNIPPQGIPLKKKVKKVILNEEGHLILVHEKGEVNSAFLAEYPPEIVMAVLWVIIPELAKVIMLYRKKISTRINFFGKLKKELKGVVKAIIGSKAESVASSEEQSMDVVKESVTSENQS
ncbi:MAG: hypothetical protein ACUVQW_01730 [Candidatus Bathycorpusculaceae bacterium]